MQHDASLAGTGLVIFDEFHERHLEADLGLALCLDLQGVLNPHLKLSATSATMETGPVAALLGGAPVVACEGRLFEVETRYAGRGGGQPLEREVAAAVLEAAAAEAGSILFFARCAGDSPGAGAAAGIAFRAGVDAGAAFRQPDPRGAGPGDRPGAGGSAQDRAGHQHRREQPDHRRHPRGGRQRICVRPAVRCPQRHDAPGDPAGRARVRRPAPRPGLAARGRGCASGCGPKVRTAA